MLRLKNVDRVNVRKEWKDGARKKLENQLNDFIAHLYLAGEALKEKRIEDEQAERARLERQIQEHKEYLRRMEEERKAKELGGLMDRWRLAGEIREFVREALSLGADRAGRLEWALQYADSVDPLQKLRADRASGPGEGESE